ncbi:MAG: hypothetical protein IE933_04060 [Sphingomonadales bacterium]|nr:hypothetical protein [Sphingomonadales bacterium]MBD3772532.1 hypothetical protein [Paracoccaceae bacterium]
MGYLTDEEHTRISQAVAAAEEHTAGEIVTVLADRSDGYSDIALAWASLASLLVLGALASFPDFYLGLLEWAFNLWGHEWTPRYIFAVAAIAATAKFAGVYLLLLWDPLRFLLVPGIVKTRRVHHRAIAHFKVGAERRTHGRTGVLIYLSMREHRAEIFADEAIASRVTPETWGEAMADMLREIRHGRIADGMIAGVRDVGVVLAEHFPRAEDDQNELPDRLIEV